MQKPRVEPSAAYALPFDTARLSGLRPQAWVSVGAGFSREGFKSLLLNHGVGFVSSAVTSPTEIALRVLGRPLNSGLVAPTRQEVLRALLSEPRISARLPELRRLKRGAQFFRRLDLALQSGRLAFSHEEEAEVYEERLSTQLGANLRRAEVRMLAQAYEAWLEGADLLDPPMALAKATEWLTTRAPAIALPDEIIVLTAQQLESRERSFWEALGRYCDVRMVGTTDFGFEPSSVKWFWDRWHTLDDAAEALADSVDAATDVVLIPDEPEVRRAIKRALAARGIPEDDPRDPFRLRSDETVKWALLPLQMVASRFERERVLAWLRAHPDQTERVAWSSEIAARGVRDGLRSYAGGLLTGLHAQLTQLENALGRRMKVEELAEAHVRVLRESIGSDAARAWVLPVCESLWSTLAADLKLTGHTARRAPVRFWLERFMSRLAEAAAPPERLRAVGGVRVFRYHQAPLAAPRRVWLFGLSKNDPAPRAGNGDYWFSERDREVLAGEFAVRSALQARAERLSTLQQWLAAADEVHILDAHYAFDGRERISIAAVVQELRGQARRDLDSRDSDLLELDRLESDDRAHELVRVERGAHPRWLASFGAVRSLPPQAVNLPPIQPPFGGLPELSATALDRYSRCSFQSLAFDRWRVRDLRPPEHELWPEVRGNILHEAVRRLVAARADDGNFSLSPEQALEEAWAEKRPKGLLKGERIATQAKARLLRILVAFMEKERDYVTRAGTKVISLDDRKLSLEVGGARIVGQPDRVDEHPDGLFVIDYKTSTASPNGTDMVDLGYRLQLPFYALAAKKNFAQEVLGVQFVELSPRASRSSGIFFKAYNGKAPGRLTNVQARSKSLFDEPGEIWARLEKQVQEHAKGYVEGHFEARPKRREKECRQCAAADLCGFRRLLKDSEEGGEASGDEGEAFA